MVRVSDRMEWEELHDRKDMIPYTLFSPSIIFPNISPKDSKGWREERRDNERYERKSNENNPNKIR